MRLTQREIDVLNMVINQADAVQLDTMMRKLNLSLNQFRYAMDKINHFLSEQGLSWMNVDRDQVTLPARADVKKALNYFVAHTTPEQFRYSQEQIQTFIFLKLLLADEPVPTTYFIDTLYTSRTTVIRAISFVRKQSEQYDLTFVHLHRVGYLLEGTIFQKLTLFLRLLMKTISVREIYSFYYRDSVYSKMGELILFNVFDLDRLLAALGETIKYAKTMSNLDDMDFCLLAILDYKFRDVVTANTNNAGPEMEELAHLGAKILANETQAILPDERELINYINEKVHSQFSLQFDFSAQFVDVLSHHIRRFMLRQKNSMQMNDIDVALFLKDYEQLNQVITDAVRSYPHADLSHITPSEIMLITLYYASELEKHTTHSFDAYRVLVVCAQGQAVSSIIRNKLARLIDSKQIDTSAVYEVNERQLNGYDLVISTVRLPGVKFPNILYVQNAFSKDIVQMVRKRLAITNKTHVGTGIDKFTAIMDVLNDAGLPPERVNQMEMEILQILAKPTVQNTGQAKASKASLVINPKLVNRITQTMSWQEAFKTAAQPMIDQHLITAGYVNKIITNTQQHGLYMMVIPGLVLAHAGEADGIRQNGIGITVFDSPISPPDPHTTPSIQVVVTIAFHEREAHPLIQKLIDWLLKGDTLNQLTKFTAKEEVVDEVNRLFFGQGV